VKADVTALLQWCDRTAIGAAIPRLGLAFPGARVVHPRALAPLGGTVLLIDLRLMGLGFAAVVHPRLAVGPQPWMLTGLWGDDRLRHFDVPVRSAQVPREFPFQLKMLCLLLALLFTLGAQPCGARNGHGTAPLARG
jgi:hypothetical protein